MSKHPLEAILFAVVGAFAVIGMTACAFSPTSEQAQKFGKTTATSLGAFSDAAQAGDEMRLQIAIHQSACQYLAGRGARLAAPLHGHESPSLAARIELLDSLIAYADSLVAATNPALTAELEKNAAALASSVTRFTGAAATALTAFGTPVTSNAVVGPAAKLFSTILVDIVEYETRYRLRTIIEEMHPKVVLARRVVLFGPRPTGDDFEVVGQRLQDDHRYLMGLAQRTKAMRACVLQRVRGIADAVGAYRLFIEMDDASRQLDARIALFSNRARLTKLLDAVVASHNALLSDEADFNRSMREIQAILTDIRGVITALDR